MKFEKIIISIILLTVCGAASASVSTDDELNPVDVINDYLAAEENASAQQMSQKIIDLLIPANFVAIAGATPNTSLPITNELSRKLWKTDIAVADENDTQNTANLFLAIEKINSLKFEQPQTNQPAKPEPAEIVQPAVVVPKPEKIRPVPAEPVVAVVTDAQIAENDKKKTADALVGIENRISDVETPYEMAELLFRAGHLNQAAAYYKQTLKSGSCDNRPQDKAWILFQLGNCLKESSPAEAMKIYSRLLSEHPDSTWTKMARQYNELLTLQIQNKPYELIKQQADELRKARANE